METKIKETIKLIRLLVMAIVVLFGVTLLSFITLKNDNQRVNAQTKSTNTLPKSENQSAEVVKGKGLFETTVKVVMLQATKS
jgi:CHASE3 domain sensor protein